MSCLGQYNHPNLVELIGCCCEDDHRLLVYEYMAKGSLENHLFRRTNNTCTNLLKHFHAIFICSLTRRIPCWMDQARATCRGRPV